MRDIRLKPRNLTPAIAREMEERGLVSWVRHPGLEVRRGMTRDFTKGPDFPAAVHGFHSVTVTFTDIFLASHPKGQEEIVFLWDAEPRARPLYFVFARDRLDRYAKLLAAGMVAPSDYLALRIPLNDPRWSAFQVHAGTVHCELTDRHGPRLVYPSFFVLEPVRLSVRRTDEARYGVRLVLAS
jgi:hypothetical protein